VPSAGAPFCTSGDFWGACGGALDAGGVIAAGAATAEILIGNILFGCFRHWPVETNEW
jgi:hypothetical protein